MELDTAALAGLPTHFGGLDWLLVCLFLGGSYFTGVFAVLVGGLYWRRASRTGAYLAFACGL